MLLRYNANVPRCVFAYVCVEAGAAWAVTLPLRQWCVFGREWILPQECGVEMCVNVPTILLLQSHTTVSHRYQPRLSWRFIPCCMVSFLCNVTWCISSWLLNKWAQRYFRLLIVQTHDRVCGFCCVLGEPVMHISLYLKKTTLLVLQIFIMQIH